VIGEIAERHGLVGVEVVENADLVRADLRPALRVADVAAVAGEVDARVVAKHRGDIGTQSHGEQWRQ